MNIHRYCFLIKVNEYLKEQGTAINADINVLHQPRQIGYMLTFKLQSGPKYMGAVQIRNKAVSYTHLDVYKRQQ